LLAELVVAGTPAGRAQGPDLAPSLRGAALTVAGHDHQTAAYAVGAARPGYLLDSLGTAEGLVRCVEGPMEREVVGRLASHRITAGWGVVRGHYSVLAGMRTGLTLEHIASLIGADSRAARIALGQAALDVTLPPPPFAVLTRDDVPPSKECMDEGLSPAGLWAAAIRDLVGMSGRLVERMDAEVGPHKQVVVAGGWTRNPAVLAAKLRQYPTATVSPVEEAGALGAALLAGVAAGEFASPVADDAPGFKQPTRAG
jgi:sugar (pentulose or hexulose) kinase